MAGTGILSKGIKLSYEKTNNQFVEIPDLQEVPELGGSVEKVEVTTLADGAKRYIKGIVDYGDLSFKFLYDNSTAESSYRVLKGIEDAGQIKKFKVEFPDKTVFAFSASVITKVSSAGVNGALTFTANLTLNSKIEVTHPTALVASTK